MLKVHGLKATVSQKQILNGIDLSVKPGEIHVIMGPNGSGKSTLAYTLAGHPSYKITKGSVFLEEVDITQESPDIRAKKGLFLAFQYPVSIEGVSVQNFLRTAFQATHPQNKQKVSEFRNDLKKVAKQLGLPEDMLKRSLNEGFSGGEKKRVEVLQMLVLRPKIAICDETDSGLDIDSIKLAADGINQVVKKHNTGVIIITHYQRILKYINPDRVHVMLDGKIAKTGGMELVKDLEKSGYKNISK